MAQTEPKTKEPLEITQEDARQLAESVRKIDKAMKDFIASGLTRKALVVLLNDATGVAKRDINAVLDGLESLGAIYLESSKK
jgi:hypothetical protein